MKLLILTSLSGSSLMRTDLADQVIVFSFRFVWDRLPSADELATYVAPRSEKNGPCRHWSDFTGRWRQANKGHKNLGLVEFCEPYETIELWFDPHPNDQLQLIWLLDYFRAHRRLPPSSSYALLTSISSWRARRNCAGGKCSMSPSQKWNWKRRA